MALLLLQPALPGAGAAPALGPGQPPAAAAPSPLEAEYRLSAVPVRLTGGSFHQTLPEGASGLRGKVTLGPVFSDLDGDGDLDGVVAISASSGGSGTFLYVAPALLDNGAYHGGEGVLVGDRVRPLSLAARDRLVTLRYLDRRPGEPFAHPPGVARTMRLELVDGHLVTPATTP